MSILITGSNGLLGQKIVALCQQKNLAYLATSRGENRNPDCPATAYRNLDITDRQAVLSLFGEERPHVVIHTAALTNVDQCELEPDLCQAINVDATAYLIEASNACGAHFIFISTDFIFDGQHGPYSEEDASAPLSVYGKSKELGEQLVIARCNSGWAILRTIIVYGLGHALTRSNLIVWAKGALQKGEPMHIIDDQFRAPTYAPDLADACIAAAGRRSQGVFHICGPETLSIYEIVERIAKHYDCSMDKVTKISSATLNQPAQRPPRTGFVLDKARKELAYHPHTLEETLDLMFP
jgi:dTDP-4-dehydrorhamnose reductase